MTTTNFKRAAVLTLVLATGTIGAAGCRNQGRGGSGDATASTAPGANATIPTNARKVAEAHNGQRINHRVLRQGTIYVQEAETGRVVYSSPVRASSNVTVDPKANAIAINDMQAQGDPQLDTHRGYRLFFSSK